MSEHTQDANTPRWGRIYMDSKVADLQSVEEQRALQWTDKDQEEYLERVKQKAEEKAREILLSAQLEAKSIRETAQNEGYAAGIEQAENELAELRSSMGDTVQLVLGAIEQQSASIYSAWREDLAALVRLAVEKGLAICLDEERGKVLEGLFDQAVRSLESARQLVVRCNPQDAGAVEDIIAMGQEKYPDLKSWKVRAEADIEPGGILVESESSLANNSLESRKAAIDSVLQGLNLPGE